MMTPKWRWAGARSIGTSHLKSSLPCQDFGGAFELTTTEYSAFVAIVSDGAGSASHSHIGSRVVTTTFLRCVRSFIVNEGKRLSDLDREKASEFIDAIRDKIYDFAERGSLRPRDFASTVVALLIDDDQARIIHVGDGAAVIKSVGSDDWLVPSWPFQGEYASTTSFVTDDPEPQIDFVVIDEPIGSFAVFSDGIERMVLDFAEKIAYPPFFNRVISPVMQSAAAGRDIDLSNKLRTYLSSEAVCERTDDDKTLILGTRI